MNIIEAIKSGKPFRRKSWSDKQYYLHINKYNKVCLNIDEEYGNLDYLEIMENDWEVKEENTLENKDVNLTFDPAKPAQTRDGRKVRILCTNRNAMQRIVSLITEEDGVERTACFWLDGKYSAGCETIDDLINIPEPKPIDIHVGGVYKDKSGNIGVCSQYLYSETSTYTKYIEFLGKNFNLPSREYSNNNIVEHLGDIQNLHEYIKDKLK